VARGTRTGSALAASLAQLRDGSWFDRKRVRAAFAILFAVELAAFIFLVAGTHGLIVPVGPTTTDFVSFYAAGALADAGSPALAYDHAAHHAAEERATEPGIQYQYFNYPPVFLLLCATLAPFPYLVAFVLFEGATLALFLFVGLRILGERSGTAMVGLLALPVVFWNLGLGQNAFLTAGLFGAATLLIDRRPVVAGLLFGALCYKPQLGILIPLALAAAGQWRAFAAAAVVAVALVAASVALFGIETWQAFLHTVGAAPIMYESGRIRFGGMANLFGGARLVGVDAPLAYALQAIMTLLAAGSVVAVWRARLSLPTRAAMLAAAAVVAAPLALLYDLMLSAVAAAWLVRDRHSAAAWKGEATLLAGLYLLLLLGIGAAERFYLPVFPLSALALFALAARRAWKEAALRREATPGLREAAPLRSQ
jgi:alpha-1,2-mannosyltransferase